jgi:hypothetical protein
LKMQNYDLEVEIKAKNKTISILIVGLVILMLARLVPWIIKLVRNM